ncbi:hypothetical protein [Lentzea sp.]|uniref:hypothetical protein n=1 Tax=Lentzea sp. TaxID=56099 RepID=UPI002BB8771A|nr:hypothetical protein [Lentzea sp.]HUQ58793.1 hypothetical protein [Lentzea sp.]
MSDSTGKLRFDRVPAGSHRAHVEGPWTYRSPVERDVTVTANREAQLAIFLEPKVEESWPPTPGPLPAGPGGAAPEPSAGVVLARTGASLLGLGLFGALPAAFGAGALTASRNREAGSRSRA